MKIKALCLNILFFLIFTAGSAFSADTTNYYLRGYININNGAPVTNSVNVTLSLKAFGLQYPVTQMCFSNDGAKWSGWENYSAAKEWQLPQGEGLKTVYARFKNSQGQYLTSSPADSIYYTTQIQNSNATIVKVSGKQLLIQKPGQSQPMPYKIKGVCWSPASIGIGNNTPLRENEFAKWYKQDIALMREEGINTVRTFLDFGQNISVFTAVLDELYANGIMVIMAADDSAANLANIDWVVSNFKNHPAILMWQIGNEWNLNRYYNKFPNFDDAIAFTENAAQKIKQLDPFHPAVSILGDSEQFIIPALGETWRNSVIEYFVSKRCPSVDIWGFNIYRSGSFGGLFYEWMQISPKPMFISEAGTDAYDTRINNENSQMQSDFNAGLWDEVYFHLSADRPGEPCLGITFFEWNDEWWKYINSWNHEPGNSNGSMPYAHPDNVNDEEYFGLVDINRAKRQVYWTLEEKFKKQGQMINLPAYVTLKAKSAANAMFFINSQRFYDKIGYGGGGRGINFATIDPKTGLVEEVVNFDTWLISSAVNFMSAYISQIPNGKIILAAVADESGSVRTETGYQALESIGSAQNQEFKTLWAMGDD